LAGLIALLALPVRADERPLVGQPIDEGATSKMTFQVQDTTGAAVTTRDLFCWVDDVETTTRLYGPIAPTPGTPVTITLPPQAHQIVTNTKDLEEHVLTCIGRGPGGSGCPPAPTPVNANCDVTVGAVRWLVQQHRVSVGGSTPAPSPAPTPTAP